MIGMEFIEPHKLALQCSIPKFYDYNFFVDILFLDTDLGNMAGNHPTTTRKPFQWSLDLTGYQLKNWFSVHTSRKM